MKLLKELGDGQGYLKAGFLGFQGSGKTYTATLLAIATRRAFGLKGPIVFIDTENATEYIAPLVLELTGLKLIGIRTRRFEDLVAAARESVEIGAAALVADSMTHFWRSLCDSYLAGINARSSKKRYSLEFRDWGQVKGQWANWTDLFLNSPLHCIICGRAGFEYDMTKNEETGRNELIKTGIKMKTEAEFGFEPSLLVQMEVDQEPDPKRDGKFRQIRSATVIKDRFAVIDASVFGFPGLGGDHKAELDATWAAFSPHVNKLIPGSHSTVETHVPPLDVDEEGDVDWQRERKARQILCEEIQGVLVSSIPGQGAEDKKRKADLLQAIFNTRSWTAVESTKSEILRFGLAKLKEALQVDQPRHPAPAAPTPVEQQADDSQLADMGLVPAAPAPAPKPTPPPAPAPAKAPELKVVGGSISEDLAVQVSKAISPFMEPAITWLINNKHLPPTVVEEMGGMAAERGAGWEAWIVECGWLKSRLQQHLPEKMANKILKQTEAFKRAVAA